MTVTLPADLQAFVDEQVKAGRYPDVDAALADAVRNLQLQVDEDDATRARLRAAVQEGLADLRAGRTAPLDVMAILAEVEAEFDKP
jgi:putative addiction module CopG family antidote